MAAGNQRKHLEFTFSIKALPFHSRASIRVHKHIFKYLKWSNCWKSRGETFFNETAFLFWCHALWKLESSNCCIFEMKHASGLETCTKIYFLFIFNLVWIRLRNTLLFWLCNLMTSLWKPSIDVFHAKVIHTMRRRQNALRFHKWSSIIIHKLRMKWGLKNPIKCHHIPF